MPERTIAPPAPEGEPSRDIREIRVGEIVRGVRFHDRESIPGSRYKSTAPYKGKHLRIEGLEITIPTNVAYDVEITDVGPPVMCRILAEDIDIPVEDLIPLPGGEGGDQEWRPEGDEPEEGGLVEHEETREGDTIHNVVFKRHDIAGGKTLWKSSRMGRKVVYLESPSSIEPEIGVPYDVRIIQDSVPGDPNKGRLTVRIIGEAGVPIAEKKRERKAGGPQEPIAVDTVNKHVYVLETQLALMAERGPLVPPESAFTHFTLDKRTLETIEKVATAVELRQPCLLEGETSTSKTSSIEYLAMKTGHEVVRLNLNGQTDTTELIGKFVPNDGQLQITFENLLAQPELLDARSREILETANKRGQGLTLLEAQKIATIEKLEIPEWRWQDGIIPAAMKRGQWVILDEINLAEPQILERLNSVLERNPSLTLSENGGAKIGPGGEFELHEEFRIFATMNPAEYSGRQPMSPAYKNRWLSYKLVPPPTEKEYEQMLGCIVFGEQPLVEIRGKKYQADSVKSLCPATSFVLEIRQFFAKLAKFHVVIEGMARKREIARGKKEQLVFTRRELLEFLTYIEQKKFHDRKGGTTGVHDDPKRVLESAMQYFYLDKITDAADLASVQTQLKAVKICPGDTWDLKFGK